MKSRHTNIYHRHEAVGMAVLSGLDDDELKELVAWKIGMLTYADVC